MCFSAAFFRTKISAALLFRAGLQTGVDAVSVGDFAKAFAPRNIVGAIMLAVSAVLFHEYHLKNIIVSIRLKVNSPSKTFLYCC